MILRIAHQFLVVLYVTLPAVVLLAGLTQRRRNGRGEILWMLLLTAAAGTGFGVAMSYLYARVLGAGAIPAQMALAAYFATAMLLLLKAFDGALLRALRRLLGARAASDPRSHGFGWRMRLRLALLLRAAIMLAVGLPFVMAAILTYRPKVHELENPQSLLGFDFEHVTFHATDGVPIDAWWIPARPPEPRRSIELLAPRGVHEWGKDTVLVCHGLGANKANQLVLARDLAPAGYNALVFDFRARGASGGQLTSFGDLERRDVLGAVRWLRAHRAAQSQRILGVGASMGAVALIEAAADPSSDGQAIRGIALYAGYDSLPRLARKVSDTYLPPPVGWLAVHLGLPFASLQTGADLDDFEPVRDIGKLWPRPVLVIHGVRDDVIPFELGQRLFDSATQPKQRLWISDGGHNDVINSDTAAKTVLEFFDRAPVVPVI